MKNRIENLRQGRFIRHCASTRQDHETHDGFAAGTLLETVSLDSSDLSKCDMDSGHFPEAILSDKSVLREPTACGC